MLGNVWEWAKSNYDEATDDLSYSQKVIRGGITYLPLSRRTELL
jgi:hypothetical protein